MSDAPPIDTADRSVAYRELAEQLRALLFGAVPDINWAGFYLLCGDTLVLGPFQGKPACVRIPSSRGVCGAASRSELVVPILDGGVCRGVSTSTARSKTGLVGAIRPGWR